MKDTEVDIERRIISTTVTTSCVQQMTSTDSYCVLK